MAHQQELQRDYFQQLNYKHRAPQLPPLSRRASGNGATSSRAFDGAALPWLTDRETMRQLVDAAEGLFTPCPQCHDLHNGSRDSHVSFLDVDDPFGRAYCHFCRPVSAGARVVQVRRNTYHDVMRIGDMSMLYDISGIQQYTINNGKVIFLRPRPQMPKHGYVPNCYYCHRSLMDNSSRFCSLECKLNKEDGLAPLTPAEILAVGDNRKVKIPRRLAEQQRYETEQGEQEGQQRRENGITTFRDSSNGGDAAQAAGPDTGDWDENDGGVAVAVMAGVAGGPWLGGRLTPLFGVTTECSPGEGSAAAARAAGAARHRPPRPPSLYGGPPPESFCGGAAPSLRQEGNGRPQRQRQPPERISNLPASNRPGGVSLTAAAAAAAAVPTLDRRSQVLAAAGGIEDAAVAAAAAAAARQRQPTRHSALARASSAPPLRWIPGGEPPSSGDGAAAKVSASLDSSQPQIPQSAAAAASARNAGLGDYMLSLLRTKYCRAATGDADASGGASAAAQPRPPMPAVDASAASALGPEEAAAVMTAALPPLLQSEAPVVNLPRRIRRVSAGPGPPTRLPMPSGSHSFAGLLPLWAETNAAVGAKRRCVSIDLGVAAADGATLGGGGSGGGSGSGSGGGGQPEVTSPLRRHFRGREAVVTVSADELTARMALLSPTRIARRNSTTATCNTSGDAPSGGHPSTASGVELDLGTAAKLLASLVPVRPGADGGSSGGSGIATASMVAVTSGTEAFVARSIAIELDADAGTGVDVRRVKPRKGRPQQAAM